MQSLCTHGHAELKNYKVEIFFLDVRHCKEEIEKGAML